MKITMAKRDDILKRKQAYDDAVSQKNAETQDYWKATRALMDSIQDLIRDKIGETTLNLEIRVDESWGGSLEVRINNGDDPHDSQALNWNWTASMTGTGEIKKESGSWSGLSATTPEQIANLKESVRIIEILNNLDWNELLTVDLPNYDDYVKTEVPQREDFDQELLEADVEEAAEKGLLIKGHGYKWYSPRASVFYKIIDMTDKSFKVQEIYENDLNDENRWSDPYTIRKAKFFEIIDRPIKTVEV